MRYQTEQKEQEQLMCALITKNIQNATKKDLYRGSTTISLLSKLGTEVGLSAQIMLLGDSGKALLPDHDQVSEACLCWNFSSLKSGDTGSNTTITVTDTTLW